MLMPSGSDSDSNDRGATSAIFVVEVVLLAVCIFNQRNSKICTLNYRMTVKVRKQWQNNPDKTICLENFYAWQWCSQPKFLGRGGQKIGGSKMFDLRQITLFCLRYRLSKHKITIYAKNLGGHGLVDPPDYASDA